MYRNKCGAQVRQECATSSVKTLIIWFVSFYYFVVRGRGGGWRQMVSVHLFRDLNIIGGSPRPPGRSCSCLQPAVGEVEGRESHIPVLLRSLMIWLLL